MNKSRPRAATHGEGGFTYVALLAAVAVLGVGLTAASELWVSNAHREKLVELEWIGEQFVRAIGSYYFASPGSAKVYPASLDDLLEDQRYLTVRRHLRVVYANPFTGISDWATVRGVDGRVRGVRIKVTTSSGVIEKTHIFVPNEASSTPFKRISADPDRRQNPTTIGTRTSSIEPTGGCTDVARGAHYNTKRG